MKTQRPRSRRGFARQPENSKRVHFRAPALPNSTKIPRENPQRKREKERNEGREREKSAKFWASHPSGPQPFGPQPFGLHLFWVRAPTLRPPPLRAPASGPPLLQAPTPSGPPSQVWDRRKNWPKRSGQIRSSKIGQIRPKKVGQMRPNKDGQIRFGQMRSRPKGKGKNSFQGECNHCGEFGHKAAQCPKRLTPSAECSKGKGKGNTSKGQPEQSYTNKGYHDHRNF